MPNHASALVATLAAIACSMPAALTFALPAAASDADEATLDILATTLRHNRKAVVAVNLDLEDEESAAFWPVYDRYDQERSEIQERFVGVIRDYSDHFGTMEGERASQIVADYMAIETERMALRTRYTEPFAKALPPRKLLRFLQIENKIDAVLRYELASTIPVLPE